MLTDYFRIQLIRTIVDYSSKLSYVFQLMRFSVLEFRTGIFLANESKIKVWKGSAWERTYNRNMNDRIYIWCVHRKRKRLSGSIDCLISQRQSKGNSEFCKDAIDFDTVAAVITMFIAVRIILFNLKLQLMISLMIQQLLKVLGCGTFWNSTWPLQKETLEDCRKQK